ncbi:MAG TPA: hypothetical protein VGD08_11870 [Stellaceae bacterium]|jgi:hypothetical protein
MRASLVRLAAASLLLAGTAAQASAQDRWHDDRRGWDEHRRDDRGGDRRDAERWRDRDIHHFREHDFDRWRAGRWYQGRHDGRAGWWWVVGGTWYYYPQPVYPYPDPYQPPVAAGPPPSPGAVYYYCDQPSGYYPYVPSCPSGWRMVPAG